jgi:hypothetical protein
VDLPAGSVSSLLVLDRPDGGLTMRVVLDAAGPAAVPSGPVPAGAGGGAGPAIGLWGVALGGALTLTGRRRAVLTLVAALGTALLPIGPAAAEPTPGPTRTAMPLTPAQPAAAPAIPIRLRIPSAGVDTALGGISLAPGGVLAPPAEPAAAGWFEQGPVPGEPGPAVITGHVDGTDGPGVFFRLRNITSGDPVVVTRADGSTVRFTVTRVARYAKDAFPTAQVYGPTPGAELRLITCGGDLDRLRGSYRDNLVVYARPG